MDELFDCFKERWIILAHVVVELRLALRKVIIGELFHQAQHGVEGAPGLAPGLVERPQPGHVNVGVTGGYDLNRQCDTGLGNARY